MKKQLLIIIAALFVFGCDKSEMNAKFSGSGTGGSLARFTIVNNFLYAVDKENLRVFDVSSPSQPVFKRNIPVGFEIETIYPFGDKLFIGSTSMVHIFEISDPANPTKLSEAISPTVMRRCDPVVAKDTVAYATLRTNGECGGTQSILAAYDIRNITRPVQKAAVPVQEPYGLGYSDNVLYVCDKMMGLAVFDITNAYNPVYVRSVLPGNNGNFIDVIPYNNILICWTTKGMVLFDIANKQNPALISQIF
jgi:hypothetical protein